MEGTPNFVILDHHDILEVTPATKTIVLFLLGKDVTQSQFHLEIGDKEANYLRSP